MSNNITQIATTMVPVEDQDKALAFYTDKLGFETRADIPYGNGERWIEVAPPGGASTVALTGVRVEGEWVAGRQTGISFATTDIHADHAKLRDAGVDVDAEVSDFGGPVPPMFWLRDLDGNSLLVVGGPSEN
jgi:catechol 2,3-dioxygenase-like lactoylglutathione lyase family enzyme